MSFSSKISKSDTGDIFLIRTTSPDGRAVWCYLKVFKQKKLLFERAVQSGEAGNDVSEWGEIIFSGYGEKIPPFFVQHMKNTYGFVTEE